MRVYDWMIKNKEIGILFILTIIFFWKIPLHYDQMIYPALDIVSQNSYWKWLFASTLNQYGELPLWNPYVFSGTPFGRISIGTYVFNG